MEIFNTLSYSPLFKGLDAEAIETIMADVVYQIREFGEGDMIMNRHMTCEFQLLVLEGTVKGEMLDASGKTIKIEDIEAVRPLAPAFVFGQDNRFPVDIIALTQVKIMYIPKPSLITIMQKSNIVLTNFLNAISNRAQFLSERLYFLSFKTLRSKIANYLLELAKKNDPVIKLPCSHQQLAEMFGVTRPSLSRTMGDLEKEGIIRIQRRNITIVDRQKLLDQTE